MLKRSAVWVMAFSSTFTLSGPTAVRRTVHRTVRGGGYVRHMRYSVRYSSVQRSGSDWNGATGARTEAAGGEAGACR